MHSNQAIWPTVTTIPPVSSSSDDATATNDPPGLTMPEAEQVVNLDDYAPAFPFSPIADDVRSQARQLFLRYPERDDLCVAAHVNKLNFPGHQDELHMHLHALGLLELEPYLVWIPYSRFADFAVLGHGAFAATVYRATVGAQDQRMFLRIDANEGVDMRSELYFALKELDERLLQEVILNAHLSFHRIHSSQMERVTKELVGLTRNEMTGRYMMILEYASAGNLETLLHDTPPRDWATITRHALNIARALTIIHELDLVHNDLHPGNVVYDRGSDTPFIIDIGLGAALGRSQDEMGFYGRLEYLPPEVFRGESCTQKSDVYCFGTLMWTLVTGVTPRMYHARPQFADGMREEPVPGMPKSYEDIYVDCWNPDPEVRPTMVEVEQWLEEILEEMEQASMAPETVAYVEARRNERETVLTRGSVCSNEFVFDDGTSRVTSISSFYNHEELSRIRSRTTIYDVYSKTRRRTTYSVFNLDYDGTELRSNSLRISTESETTLVDRALRGHQAELQNLRVTLDDPMYKVLMMTLRKYGVNDDWQNYSLWI
ncbi:kinase-like domain-containing protein, partial [Endogone sp. FLAS-F59071]